MKDLLVVEDGVQERERLQRLFRDAGYTVEACATVGEAEKLVQSESFRAAILDVGLSDKSGSYLFNAVKKSGRVSYVVIFTGNPSVHLKQRFMDEGAVDYIVKGSPQAQNDHLLSRVRELIGSAQPQAMTGIALDEFLSRFVKEQERRLFLDLDNSFPPCRGCGAREYCVTFSHVTQVPPDVHGRVVCQSCARPLDPEIG